MELEELGVMRILINGGRLRRSLFNVEIRNVSRVGTFWVAETDNTIKLVAFLLIFLMQVPRGFLLLLWVSS